MVESRLLPDSNAEFRSVAFWDGFFKTRGDTPFEWYGDWKQLRALIKPKCKTDCRVLVAGCGNSELSADMYDAGYEQITNLDFSKLVIMNMMRKNLRQRPQMKWIVGDMTNMKFSDSSFDVVLDKGGLDALLGEDADEGSEAGTKFLQEVQRVLAGGGTYICISLLQAHVLRLLLNDFKDEWQFILRPVPPSPDMARAELQPMCVYVKRRPTDMGPERITSAIKIAAKSPNAHQLNQIDKVLKEVVAEQTRKKPSSTVSKSKELKQWAEFHPNTRVLMEQTQHKQLSARSEKTRADMLSGQQQESRFSVAILDVSEVLQRVATLDCCVFLVPQGRESEWLFASEEGQWQLAAQCSCKRLILVSFGRGHSFGSTEEVQKEVSAYVWRLAPSTVRRVEKGVPFLTCQDGAGNRRPVASLSSPLSGNIVVEDVELREGEESYHVRRLVFVSNSNLIQSEARLHKAGDTQTPGRLSDPNGAELDVGVLCMDYHKQILAGLISGSCLTDGEEQAECGGRGMLVGLGGGCLAELLCSGFQVSILAVELDPVIVKVAKQYFGLRERQELQVTVGDGLESVANYAKSAAPRLDFLVLDAGSNDGSLAMSCPPPAFLQPELLKNASSAVKESGVLVVNCVSRSQKAFTLALEAVKATFKLVKFTSVENDVNKIIFASQANPSLQDGFADMLGYSRMLNQKAKCIMTQAQIDSLASDLADVELCI